MSEQISLLANSEGGRAGKTEGGKTGSSSNWAMFDEHKGKLAIGVAATLGAMIFYNWRERRLARNDPEGHARVNRLKALLRANSADTQNQECLVDAEDGYDGNLPSQMMNCPDRGGIAVIR